MKICICCNEYKETSNFYKTKGKNNRCKVCCLNYQKDYYIRNKNKILEQSSIKTKSYENKTKKKEYNKIYHKSNLGKFAAKTNKYRAAKLQATPKWLTKKQLKQMEDMYINCPKGYQVDHIIPLQGINVCGLHVPWNLQYLTVSDNIKKRNKVIDIV